MTITAFPARNEYTATAGQTLFTYTFKIYASTDLNVYVTPSGQDANDATDIVTGYSVTGLGDEDGGTITLVSAASVGDLVTIVSDIPENRTTDYQDNGDFLPVTVNADFDRVVSLTKQEADRSGRTLAFQESLQGVSELTLPAPEALKYVRWKADESGQENVDPVDADTIVQSDFVERVENISELANLTIPSANKTYEVLGRTTAGDGGGGTFYWDSSDLSTEVTADTQSGIYVAPDTDLTGASGAWVRRFSGAVNVRWFGATGAGTDQVTEFQASIDSTTDGQITVIVVPLGVYDGDYTALIKGTRTVVFMEMGDVTYTGTAPTGDGINRHNTSTSGGDITRPWSIGAFGIIQETTTVDQRPPLRIQKTITHTGPSSSGSTLSIFTKVDSNVDNNEHGIVSNITSDHDDAAPTGVGPSMVGVQGASFKLNTANTGTFGGNFIGRDQSGRASSISRGGVLGMEVNSLGSGPDDLGVRVGIDVVNGAYSASVDGATSVQAGVRIRPSANSTVGNEPCKILYGVKVEEGSLGSIGIGFSCDGGDRGLYLDGIYTDKAIEVDTDTLCNVLLGSRIATAGDFCSVLTFGGRDDANLRANYATLKSIVRDPTSGAEQGRLDILIPIAGVQTTVMQVSSSSASNPVNLMVDSTLKQVTQGAVDSGGSGYRTLRVVN